MYLSIFERLVSQLESLRWYALFGYVAIGCILLVVMRFFGWSKYVKWFCVLVSVCGCSMASMAFVYIFATYMDVLWGDALLIQSFLVGVSCCVASIICLYFSLMSKPGDLRISRALMRKRPVRVSRVPRKPGGFSIFDTNRDILYYGVASDMRKAVCGHLEGRGNLELYRSVENGHVLEIRYYTLRQSGRGSISYLYRELIDCLGQLRSTVNLNL